MSHEADVLACFDGLYAAACDAQHQGPGELRAFAEEIAQSERSLRFEWQQRQVRVEGDVAWVTALGEVAFEGADSTGRVPDRVTAVIVRRDGRWLWHTRHGSAPDKE